MTKSKHTPGPWASVGHILYALNDDGVNRFQSSFSPGYLTYSRHGKDEWTSEEEVLANVALAKAAPDLLEALESLLMARDPVERADAIREAHAAIAKAKGEE